MTDRLTPSTGCCGSRPDIWLLCVSAHSSGHSPQTDFSVVSYFFQLSGFSQPFLGSTALYVVLIIGVLLSVYLIERAGRRRMVLIGASICIVCDFAIGGLAFAPITGPAPKIIVAMVCIWMAGYSVSLRSIGWVYLGEIASVSLRAKSIGVASVFQSSINLMLVSRLPPCQNGVDPFLQSYTVPLMLSPQKAGWGAKIGELARCDQVSPADLDSCRILLRWYFCGMAHRHLSRLSRGKHQPRDTKSTLMPGMAYRPKVGPPTRLTNCSRTMFPHGSLLPTSKRRRFEPLSRRPVKRSKSEVAGRWAMDQIVAHRPDSVHGGGKGKRNGCCMHDLYKVQIFNIFESRSVILVKSSTGCTLAAYLLSIVGNRPLMGFFTNANGSSRPDGSRLSRHCQVGSPGGLPGDRSLLPRKIAGSEGTGKKGMRPHGKSSMAERGYEEIRLVNAPRSPRRSFTFT